MAVIERAPGRCLVGWYGPSPGPASEGWRRRLGHRVPAQSRVGNEPLDRHERGERNPPGGVEQRHRRGTCRRECDNGVAVTLNAIAIFEVRHGAITHWREYWDTSRVARQLGIDPADMFEPLTG